MWWSRFGSVWAPTVTLPEGTFFALGFGSQFLFVIPTHDLVVVHTVDMERERWPWVSDPQIGRLMWLILSAAGVGDIGPDTSVAAVDLLSGEDVKASLLGKTLRYTDVAPDGHTSCVSTLTAQRRCKKAPRESKLTRASGGLTVPNSAVAGTN